MNANHSVASCEDWIAARKRHLIKEKELTRLRDCVSAERRSLPWVKVDKEYVFHVSFTKDEMTRGKMYYNYSCYARGCDMLVGAYNYVDLVPKGRDEDALAFRMAWVRHHDKYLA